jgi:hypothetical protein
MAGKLEAGGSRATFMLEAFLARNNEAGFATHVVIETELITYVVPFQMYVRSLCQAETPDSRRLVVNRH